MAKHRSLYPERVRTREAIWQLKNRYGMTLEEYRERYKSQNGLCCICGNDGSKGRGIILKLYVDHNHDTGMVRGLLCNACNSVIGLIKEDLLILENIRKYLEEHK